ncbi:MAG: serine/threonine-protein kinase [Thermoanaerobaculia bacterium]
MPDSPGAADPAHEANWARFSALLDRLLELDPDSAAAEVARLPVEDESLRKKLAAALAAAWSESGLFARSAVESWSTLLAASEERLAVPALAPGVRLGVWEIEEEIGRGGMGTVFAVHRADGVYEQRAALKLLAASADAPATRARFLQERQILARLEHPAIAHLFDGGVAPDGRPWLVIERVDGAPITTYADSRRLSIEQRLALIQEVLAAVDYAHRNLVVHRDLKPANIWVSDEGAVKLLDFGIAKLLADEREGESARTHAGVTLTPQYAAPEQVTGGVITTATDVYSLGLVLYELLAGARPYRVTGDSVLVLERAIVATEAPPLAAAYRSSASLAAIADARSTTPERLARRLSGDLDAIVQQALAKDPAARYSSATALARDLADHLAGRPIQARAASRSRRLRKFVRRHRVGFAASVALAVALVGGLVASGLALVQSRARLAEAQRAEAIRGFLLQLFAEVDPERSLGREVALREVVDRGAKRLRGELRDQPRTRAELLLTMGTLYQKLARYDDAQPLLEEALALSRSEYGATSAEAARALVALGDLAYWRDNYDEALTRQRAALAIFDAGGPLLAAEAASARFNVGTVLRLLGHHDEALAEELAALELERELHGESSLEFAAVATGAALSLHNLARDEEAIAYAVEALAIRREKLPADHPAIADTLEALGLSRISLGDSTRATRELEECLAIRRRVYGDQHPEVLEALNDLASALEAGARFEDALALRREAMSLAQRILPAGSDSLGIQVNNFAVLSFRLGNFADAAGGFRAAAASWRASAGEHSLRVAFARNNLGMALVALGQARAASVEAAAALAIRRELAGEETAEVAQSLRVLGVARLALGDYAGARSALDPCVQLSRTVYSERHPRLAEALVSRAKLSVATGDTAGARRDLAEALSIRTEKLGADHPLVAAARSDLEKLSRPRQGESPD